MAEKNFKPTVNAKYDLGGEETLEEALRAIRTAGSFSISPEVFEEIYFSPKNRGHKDHRPKFANPTPL
jgi:hypothetical protein